MVLYDYGVIEAKYDLRTIKATNFLKITILYQSRTFIVNYDEALRQLVTFPRFLITSHYEEFEVSSH